MSERIPHITRFKSWEAHDEMKPEEESTRRPTDIEVAGTRLSEIEKSPVQKEAVDLAASYVTEYLQGLGVQGRSFDSNRITFVDYVSSERGAWNLQHDWVTLSAATSEANVHVIVHELLHAHSSEWQYKPEEEVEEFSGIRPAKTGFDTIWPRQGHANFLLFNEAVTEKIAREITLKHKDAAEALPGRYMDRFNYHIQKIQRYIDAAIEDDKAQFEEGKAKILEDTQKQIDQLLQEKREKLAKLENEEKNPVVIEIEKGMIEQHTNALIKSTEELARIQIEMAESFLDISKDIREEKTLINVQNAWLKPTESSAYQDGVEILNVVLDGLALDHAAKTQQPYKEALVEVWKDLQTAYFNGSTMWLRKIERVFGSGALRAIGELTPDPFGGALSKDKNKEEIKRRLQQRVSELGARS
jgi:hypothetical protein